eukprot:3596638-Rhodomonas_salina.1
MLRSHPAAHCEIKCTEPHTRYKQYWVCRCLPLIPPPPTSFSIVLESWVLCEDPRYRARPMLVCLRRVLGTEPWRLGAPVLHQGRVGAARSVSPIYERASLYTFLPTDLYSFGHSDMGSGLQPWNLQPSANTASVDSSVSLRFCWQRSHLRQQHCF